MKVIREKHSLAMRWTHWINFPVLAVMIWSGLFIYWANDAYGITIFGTTFIQFFPEWFYDYFHLKQRLAEGMAFHFFFMWFFFLNGLLHVLYTLISGSWREMVPKKNSFKEAWQVLLHDLHIRKTIPAQNKYNAAQRIAYTAIIVMGFGSVFTGLAIYKPVQFYWICWLCGGYHVARIVHFALTIGYVLFFMVHVVQVILAGWNNFRSVVSGFEVVDGVNAVEQEIKRRTFISFSAFFALGVSGFAGWRWLYNSPEETAGVTGGTRVPLRRALNKSELFFRNFFSNSHLVKTYPKSSAASEVRVNSMIGIDDENFDPESWRLKVKNADGSLLQVSIDEIRALPKTEIVFDFKCVEGWDQIQHWAGVKMIDFMDHYRMENNVKKKYVGLQTPNGEYYVGLEMESAVHPQTILAYEMNGAPISIEHGAPLRLIIPVKYGIKNLKRIGTMTFSDQRPKDYWAEAGYDYYSGL
jgi:thiosulfate reductase cytochrome b subunit